MLKADKIYRQSIKISSVCTRQKVIFLSFRKKEKMRSQMYQVKHRQRIINFIILKQQAKLYLGVNLKLNIKAKTINGPSDTVQHEREERRMDHEVRLIDGLSSVSPSRFFFFLFNRQNANVDCRAPGKKQEVQFHYTGSIQRVTFTLKVFHPQMSKNGSLNTCSFLSSHCIHNKQNFSGIYCPFHIFQFIHHCFVYLVKGIIYDKYHPRSVFKKCFPSGKYQESGNHLKNI